jgi:hypothetical protein
MPKTDTAPAKTRLELAAGAVVTTYYPNGTRETRRATLRQWVTAERKGPRYEWQSKAGGEWYSPTLRHSVKADSPFVTVQDE